MNYKSKVVDENILFLLEKGKDMLEKVLKPKFCSKICNYNGILIGEDIKNHLKNSKEIFFLAATLGVEVDKLINKTSLTDLTLSFCIDSLADTAIENFCDEIENNIREKHTSRFSPGYGDYPIEIQPKFLNFLNSNKQIGLSCTDTYIMTPRKSVTAVIGLL
ncbi:MAG: hypothetical protein LBM93_06325 [Oscillospiraceae bacterium]|jgi:hypothetical protein|nr:hypothetical protein [Oscillospiraceae bacterium]